MAIERAAAMVEVVRDDPELIFGAVRRLDADARVRRHRRARRHGDRDDRRRPERDTDGQEAPARAHDPPSGAPATRYTGPGEVGPGVSVWQPAHEPSREMCVDICWAFFPCETDAVAGMVGDHSPTGM